MDDATKAGAGVAWEWDQGGISDKAAELGEEVVGQPVEPAVWISANHLVQVSTRGIMLYSTAGYTHFLEGA